MCRAISTLLEHRVMIYDYFGFDRDVSVRLKTPQVFFLVLVNTPPPTTAPPLPPFPIPPRVASHDHGCPDIAVI